MRSIEDEELDDVNIDVGGDMGSGDDTCGEEYKS
jgi:hypothetical protein